MLGGIAQWLRDPTGLTPHGFCLLWEPALIWLHSVSDFAVDIAYVTISVVFSVVAR